MEPCLDTDPALLDVLEELRRLEPIFHRPERGTRREDFERMTEADFWEVGASGQRYSRNYVLGVLDARHGHIGDAFWQTSDFRCQAIAPDNYLLTYTLAQSTRTTRRATIWRRTADGWKIVYHQGTIVAPT
ncbi:MULTISPECIES: DUF4440 domain-containing protein [Ralstonia solanacearum species complex]|uniref:Uncharacterized conserved protein ucp033623 n=2 Tax=Ralstonia solanacearum TaxID=305 RepID=A0ABF7RD21_RALSL|nr:DUF4440 domain-containing protein [Ralstonia solanacearum]ALF88078.1 hypothetical protein RSUY_17380 [Ralstonia solanacearum]ATI27560.1 DUF4440 domain-containing protein [Ralstonia solanacearum]EAP70864.1 Hypothetical Protein RRSL_00353 [Ralstonia solanacearum UW551]KEI33849.1 hypothetical protein CQ06_05655 [Ralstonia solanacearum]KFX80865.1 hypothetical protein KR98_01720 [Ralstonia solanacearum]